MSVYHGPVTVRLSPCSNDCRGTKGRDRDDEGEDSRLRRRGRSRVDPTGRGKEG